MGLKHSSPSTILEHMPKHPQITSERIKSHLQKYRVHRIKSKQEFMSSYESTMKKFRNGEMDGAKTLTNGEVAAHLSHAALTDVADPSNIADNAKSSTNGAAATEAQAAAPEQQNTQQQQAHPGVPPPSSFRGAAPPGHEALMLPKLTEAEKMSPIGASMGYLLGLFFSLKKQLLMQRAMNASSSNPTSEPNNPPGIPLDPSVANGPVTAVYNSFVASGPGAMYPPPLPNNAMAPPPIMASGSIDWSASSNSVVAPLTAAAGGGGGGGGRDPAQPVANPVAVQTGSTRTNLEASSMMKREMQNQMAFQNKMRALKQQELNKCKTVIPSANNNQTGSDHSNSGQNDHHQHPQQPQQQQHHHHQQQQRHEDSASSYTYDQQNANSKNSPATTPPPLGSPGISHHQQAAQTPHHSSDQDGGGSDGDANVQGAGESARARVPSFSMGGSEDFWNADVMDEQLFEFLMNN